MKRCCLVLMGFFSIIAQANTAFTKLIKPQETPIPIAGEVAFIEAEGYYPAIIFLGKAAEALYNSLKIEPYLSHDGSLVKAGPHLACAKTPKMEGIDEIMVYQCFESVHPLGLVRPGYLKRIPGDEPPDDEECRNPRKGHNIR